eukprot:CAMPEP_0203751484 /NCGR_PEP_ID=MMETSP0098-20131031/5545_1 /ASSEMBLY_ACC=CAM_ASM_000208 /TAXON_ID=96639 /ORGANISM=" , Strain NY0313808BC1" /LENGTH=157 /DNA_ID=CAMNT_0050641219 /DNA_START=122 /DNA_END=595 /DNA_ORIENTATION=-
MSRFWTRAADPGCRQDEDANVEFEVGYFDGHPDKTPEEMRSRFGVERADCWPRQDFRDKACLGHVLFLDATDELRIGFAKFEVEHDTTGHLTALFVKPEHRGKGLGKMLLEAFEERTRGLPKRLDVEPWNIRAIKFYQKHGYTRQGCGEHGEIFVKD